jgi:hypothetical protein
MAARRCLKGNTYWIALFKTHKRMGQALSTHAAKISWWPLSDQPDRAIVVPFKVRIASLPPAKPTARSTFATPSWLIRWPFACAAAAMALSAFPCARNDMISRIASCSASYGTSSPSSPRRNPKGTFPPRYRPLAFWSAFTCPMLADAVALGLGEGGGDRQKQLGQAVA